MGSGLCRSLGTFLGETNWDKQIPQETVCHHAATDTSIQCPEWKSVMFVCLPTFLFLWVHLSFIYTRFQFLRPSNNDKKTCNSQKTSRTSVLHGDYWDVQLCVLRSCQILSLSSVLSSLTRLPKPLEIPRVQLKFID